MSRLALHELCGYRSGYKRAIVNVALFHHDAAVYHVTGREVTPARGAGRAVCVRRGLAAETSHARDGPAAR